jgi:hypothetical protein
MREGGVLKMPVKRVRVHYRRFYRTSDPAVDGPLGASVAAALRCQIEGVTLDSAVRLRKYEDQDCGSVILNGRLVSRSDDVYGELVRYDPDTNITLLVHGSADVAEFEVRQADKPNDAEVLRGMSFFLLRGDHVLVIEQDMTNPIFERYLRWLLCHQTGVAKKDTRIQLIPRALIGQGGEMLRNVRSIDFKPPRLSAEELQLGHHSSKSLVGYDGAAADVLDVLKAAHFDTAVIERVAAEHNAAVELKLSVTLRAGREPVKFTGEDALALLRNVPEEDLVLHGDGARKNRGVIERLSVIKDVERKGNILDRKDAWRALREAATTYSDEGLI